MFCNSFGFAPNPHSTLLEWDLKFVTNIYALKIGHALEVDLFQKKKDLASSGRLAAELDWCYLCQYFVTKICNFYNWLSYVFK
jgi:hypothetical protein